MAFDISTAKPVGGFDLSTARPVEDDDPQSQSSFDAPYPTQDDNTWEDVGRGLLVGVKATEAGVGWLAEKYGELTDSPLVGAAGSYFKDRATDTAESLREGYSPHTKEIGEKSFLKDRSDWQDPESVKQFISWGDMTPSEALDKVQMMGAESAAGTIAGMGAGSVITSGLRLLPGIGRKLAATLGYGSGEAAVAAPAAAVQAGDEVRNLPEEDIAKHVEYQAMLLEDVPKDQARETLAKAAEGDAFTLAALSTFVLSSPFGAALDKIMGGKGQTTVSGVLKGGGTEGFQETLQSGAEQASINAALLTNADPNRPLGEDVAESMVGGLAAGTAMGGAFGAAAARDPVRRIDIEIEAAADRAAKEAEARGGDLLDQQIARQQVYWNVDMPTDASIPPGPPGGPGAPVTFEPFKPGLNALKDQPYDIMGPGGQVTGSLSAEDALEYRRPEMPGEEGLSLAPLDQQREPAEQTGNTIEFIPAASVMDEKSNAIEKAAAAYQQQKDDESLLSAAPPEREPVTVPDDYTPSKPALQEVHERVKAELDAKIKAAKDQAPGGKSKAKLADKDKEILHAIASAGGLDRAEAESHGIDPAEFGRREGGLGLVFKKKGGKSFDEMAEHLSQHGFFGDRDYTANELLDKVGKSLSGNPVYSETSDVSAERVASKAEAERLEKALHQFEQDSYEDQDEPPKGKLFNTGVDSERKLAYTILEAELAGVDPTLIDHIILDYDLPDADTESALRQAIHHVKRRRSEAQGAPQQTVGDGSGNQAAPRDEALAQESGSQEGDQATAAPSRAVEQSAETKKPEGPTDLFGAVPVAEQSLASAQRAKDEKRSGTKDVPADIDGGLFSNQSRQADIGESANPETRATPAVQADLASDVSEAGKLADGVQPADRNAASQPNPKADAPRQGAVGMKLGSGEVVLTSSGRKTTPFPKVDFSTKGKSTNTLNRADKWLIQNALNEALSRNDRFNAPVFQQALEKPSQSDKDSAEEYLFGQQPDVLPNIARPLAISAAEIDTRGNEAATSPENAAEAKIRTVLQSHTPRGHIDDLAGDANKQKRAEVMAAIKGVDTYPRQKSGTAAIREALHELVGATGETPHARDQQVTEWITTGKRPGRSPKAQDIDIKANAAASSRLNDRPDPTPAQIAADNYKKGDPFTLHGHRIVIENPRGSMRGDKETGGRVWQNKMAAHYGDLKGTTGADGDALDVFVGQNHESERIFIIDQQKKNGDKGGFDEHKIMFSFPDQAAAEKAYLDSYDKGWGIGPVTELTTKEFKDWIDNGDHTKPYADALSEKQQNKKKLAAASEKLAKEKAEKALSETMITEEYEDEDGNAVTVEQSALAKLRHLSKRIEVADKLLGCLKG